MSARLSPAASLLRNSKLFALPPAIALPPTPPSSDQVSSSDTATTVYPRYAAIETTTISGSQGDWGFKRPLPLKSTKSTSNPVVRLVRGIDTPEHVADFESAADHALTLRKFQELQTPIQHQAKEYSGGYRAEIGQMHRSVFRPTHDNTSSRLASASNTGVWPDVAPQEVSDQLPDRLKQIQAQAEEQAKADGQDQFDTSGAKALEAATRARAPKTHLRWRYAGPSLIQLSGMEFDEYLHSLGKQEQDLLVDKIKKTLVRQKLENARDEGESREGISENSITQKEVADYMRYLRNNPTKFGPVLAEMLDLPEGPSKASRSGLEPWEYGRITLATDAWTAKGPPRTHPSAGLSYLRSAAFAQNHPTQGPQKASAPVVARAVKIKSRPNGGNDIDYGVAGFIVPKPNSESMKSHENFTPQAGGTKALVRPTEAFVKEDGALVLKTSRATNYEIRDDKPVSSEEIQRALARDNARQTGPAPRMSGRSNTYQSRAVRSASAGRQPVDQSRENEDLERMLNMKPT